VIYHPEKLAALVWFSLVTWLMWRTRNIWDCVAAHAVTNLLLGIYVVTQHQWQLW
jgi:membrane protease YdiL (CAAX protease family)